MMLKSINNFPLIISLAFLCMGCQELLDLTGDGTQVTYDVKFEATTPDGTINIPETPVTIKVGQTVRFVNRSTQSTVNLLDGTAGDTEEYNSGERWFFDNGNPATSIQREVVVTYNEPGDFNVTLNLVDVGDSRADPVASKTFQAYVKVVADEPEPQETFCYLASEEGDDARSTTFSYQNTEDGVILERADKFLSSVLQEYSVYEFVDSFLLGLESFYTAAGELLGTRSLTYNSNDQLTNERVEDAEGNLVFQIGFNWEASFSDRIPIGGSIEEPDGAGGSVTTDFEYVLDNEGLNVSRVNFSRGGAPLGSIGYEFDNNPKIFTNLNYLESYPQAFNTNSMTSQTATDPAGNITSSITNTYTYEFSDEVNCGQPTSVEENNNGTIFNRDLRYLTFSF